MRGVEGDRGGDRHHGGGQREHAVARTPVSGDGGQQEQTAVRARSGVDGTWASSTAPLSL